MVVQQKAWMTSYLFHRWISHFIKNVEALGGMSPERRHLLILDDHKSHVTLEVAGEAKAAGLDLLTLPSHTLHALQPLDCIFKPFKNNFRAYRDYWSRQNVSEVACKETLVHWVSLALRKALIEKNIKSGFRATGIFPLNRGAIILHLRPSIVYAQQPANDLPSAGSEALEVPPSSPAPAMDDKDDAMELLNGADNDYLGLHEISADLAAEETTGATHFFVDVDPIDPEVPDDIGIVDPDLESVDPIN